MRKVLGIVLVLVGIVCLGSGIYLSFTANDVSNKDISEENNSDNEEMVGLPKPDNPSEADEYYWGCSTVYEVINAEESNDLLSEKEVIEFLQERGFDDYSVTYDYSIYGEYEGYEAVITSDVKHPLYYTYYNSSNNFWMIYIINGDLFAYPSSYILTSDVEVPVIFSETDKVTSYDGDTNKFYVTVPFEDNCIVKTVDKIDADLLDQVTSDNILNW